MEKIKLSILKLISESVMVGDIAIISFTSLLTELGISKEELDQALILLDKNGFISEFPTPNHDRFRVRLTQKGLDAVQDAAQ